MSEDPAELSQEEEQELMRLGIQALFEAFDKFKETWPTMSRTFETWPPPPTWTPN